MNSKFALIVSTFLMLAAIVLWSVLTPAGETADSIPVAASSVTASSVTERAVTPVSRAARANEQAAREAINSVKTDTRLDLDIRLVGATSVQLAAK